MFKHDDHLTSLKYRMFVLIRYLLFREKSLDYSLLNESQFNFKNNQSFNLNSEESLN